MSYFEDASLVYIPSAVKDAKTYSIKPTDGSGDLTFSRGSDIEATRIGADGLIQKAQVNLLLQSNSFTTSPFTSSNISLAGGQTGYDGSSDAWLMTKLGAYGSVYQTNIAVSYPAVYTASAYMKAGTQNFGSLRFWSNSVGADFRVKFDLTTGAVSTASANNGTRIDATAENVGSGWWRVSVTGLTAQTIATVNLYAGDTADASGSIYIQDAQLNYGLVAQTYQETTTAAVVSGITDNMPRLNYDPANPTCPSLLLEPSRSNIIADSEFFNNTSVWTQNPQITIDDNQDTSPEGVVNAARIYNNSGSETTIFYGASVNVGSAGTYTFSIFAKKGGLGWIRVRCLGFDAAANNNCWFDLENGVKGTNTFDEANIEDYGNGWFRISVKFTTSTDLTGTCYVYAADGDNDTTVASGASYYLSVYGAQLEAGSYPTSYIPTYGSSATRTADACSKTGISSLIGQTEGTLFFDIQDTENFVAYFGVDNVSTSTRILVYGVDDQKVYTQIRNGGTIVFSSQSAVISGRAKAAVSFNASGSVFYVNGVQVGSGSGTTYTNLSQFTLNHASQVGSKVNQALLFKTRLSNADLATLTSL